MDGLCGKLFTVISLLVPGAKAHCVLSVDFYLLLYFATWFYQKFAACKVLFLPGGS